MKNFGVLLYSILLSRNTVILIMEPILGLVKNSLENMICNHIYFSGLKHFSIPISVDFRYLIIEIPLEYENNITSPAALSATDLSDARALSAHM